MQFNKKYAIRKLAIGVASVAIGFAGVGVNSQVVLAGEVTTENFGRTNSGNVDTTGETNLPKPTEEVKSVPNGEKNFNATVAFTTEAGLGSGTLVSPDTIVTVAHNFVHLNEKSNPISVENNVNKDGDVHIATLPNGEHSKFSNADIHYWNREGFVLGYKNDLAVVKLKNAINNTPPAEITGNAKKLENGDKIHVFGFPKGKLEPILNGTVEHTENYGANIYGVAYQGSKSGASGGGLYDADGKLVGVNQNGVEGLRSGGITFSKEQLDWINSIVRGENAKPVYLTDEPKTEDKDKQAVLKPKEDEHHNGGITENSTERVVEDNHKNDETVNLHYYIDYYIPSSIEEWGKTETVSSKLIKTIEYNKPTKWIKGEPMTEGLYEGVEKTIEYNGIKYTPIGLEATRRITKERTENTDTQDIYDKYNSTWRVGTEPAFRPIVAEEGGVYRLPVFLQPQVGWITQKFLNEEYNHHKEIDFNAEDRYKLKDDVVLPYHNIDDKVEVPKAPQYIQKANRIYKLVSNDPVPNHYEVSNNSISYFYKNLNLQSTEKTVETQSLVKYKADDSKERNSENVRIDGKPKITQIIRNPKVTDDGTLSEETFEDVIQNSVDTIIKVGTKPKVEYSTKGKNIIKTTTSYSVNENTGEVTETTTSEIVDTVEGLMPPILSKDEYKGKDSTNTVLPPVVEVPEYKGTLSTNTPVDKNGDLVLPPVVEKAEYSVQKITNNDVSNKTENKQDTLVENVEKVTKDSKQVINKKEDLPKTSASFFSGLGLLAGFGLIRRKKDK